MFNNILRFSKFKSRKVERSAQNGFTLIEIMVVVAIVAILVMLATPSWQELIANNRSRTAVNDWIASTQFARSEALRTNARVTVCKSSNGTSCGTSGATGFEIGWIVKTGTSGVGGTVLQDTLAKDGVLMSTTMNSITFLPNGLPVGNFAGEHITVTDSSATASDTSTRHVCIARTGRSRVFTDAQWLALTPSSACASA